jgi:hypothetical protein
MLHEIFRGDISQGTGSPNCRMSFRVVSWEGIGDQDLLFDFGKPC